MTDYPEQSTYDHCKQYIENAFEEIIAARPAFSDALYLAVAWLYGGLPAVFVWKNAAVIGINYSEWQYYIGRLQRAITNLSIVAAKLPEGHSSHLHCAQLLQNIHRRLMELKPNRRPNDAGPL